MHYVLCIMYYALCIMYFAPCIMHHASCILHIASCIMHHASCIMYHVLCIMYYVQCALPVTTVMALKKLVNLGTRCAVTPCRSHITITTKGLGKVWLLYQLKH